MVFYLELKYHFSNFQHVTSILTYEVCFAKGNCPFFID